MTLALMVRLFICACADVAKLLLCQLIDSIIVAVIADIHIGQNEGNPPV